MRPKDWLQGVLRGRGIPVLSFLNTHNEEYLSAANIWNLASQRAKDYLKARGSLFGCAVKDKDSLIDFLALMAAEKTVLVGESELSQAAQSFFQNLNSAASQSQRGGVILKTSGSSSLQGLGRYVFLSWSQVIEQIELHALYFDHLRASQRLSLLPKTHGFGLILDFMVGLRLEQTVFLSFDPVATSKRLFNEVVANEVDLIALTPRLAWILLLQTNSETIRKGLHLHIGGAVVGADLQSAISNKGWHLHEGYGLTECGPGVMMGERPLANSEVEVRQEPGEIGQLWVKSTTLGWFEGQQLDERGFFCTGDLASVSDQGVIQILGRSGEELKLSDGTWTTRAELEGRIASDFGLSICRLSRTASAQFHCWGFSKVWQSEKSENLVQWFKKRLSIDLSVEIETNENRLENDLVQTQGKDFHVPRRGGYNVAS